MEEDAGEPAAAKQAYIILQEKRRMMEQLRNYCKAEMGLAIINEADDVVEENDSWHLQSVLGNSGGNSKKRDTRFVLNKLWIIK